MRKFTTLLLAMLMIFAMAVPAYAAEEPVTITYSYWAALSSALTCSSTGTGGS